MRARVVYRLSIWVVLFLAAVNVGVVVWLLFSMRRPYNYSVKIVQPAAPFPDVSFDVPPFGGRGTNDFSAAGGVRSGDHARLVSTNVSTAVYNHGYNYYEVSGQAFCRMHGRTYTLGSGCAYGRIVAIFPEFVLLDDGSKVVNSSLDENPEYFAFRPAFVSIHPSEKEVSPNVSTGD